jgi:hypothetical protein
MPVYVDTGVKKVLKKELLAMLKGKACFHVKKWDKTVAGQVQEALDLGYKCYKRTDGCEIDLPTIGPQEGQEVRWHFF